MQSSISKNKLSRYSSLQQKKYRQIYNEFIVEGKKGVEEFIRSGYKIIDLILVEGSTETNEFPAEKILWVSEKEMKKISSLSVAPGILGVFSIPLKKEEEGWRNVFSLVLDGIRDPGNMGTIIRTADWFGIKNIFCTEDCVDVYNSKVVQSSMGSLARVNVIYTDVVAMFEKADLPKEYNLMGAFLEGEAISSFNFKGKGALVLGNESVGIRQNISTIITHKLSIPKTPDSNTESLNVASAAAIFCYCLTKACL